MMIRQILSDEKGNPSAARVLLTASLAFTAAIIVVDSLLWATVPNAAYALMGTIFSGLLIWSAGPRIAAHFGPQIGAIASGIGAALVREPRRPELLDNDPAFRDDEK